MDICALSAILSAAGSAADVNSAANSNGATVQIIIMLIMLLCSAYFSATETAFTSLNKTRMRTLADKGNKRAEMVLSLSEQYDKLLSTILIGNNIVNIVLSSICTVFFINLLLGNQSMGTLYATVVSTIVVLIFGEISPKGMAKERPESFAMFSAPIIRLLMIVLTPLSFIFGKIKLLLSRMIKSEEDRRMTQDELLTLVDEVEQEGAIDEDEGALLRSAIEFTDREASDILTPRTALEAIEQGTPNKEISRCFRESGYSRLPVYVDSVDNIVGVIHQKDFYATIHHTEKPIDGIMKKPVYIPLSMKISEILKLLKQSKSHIAVVVDEYGGTMGIVTMEDILEELVGEIWDEHDEIVEDFVKIDDNTYKVLCTLDLDKLFKFLDIEDETDSATVNGWVLEKFGYFPTVGESFTYEKVTVEVLDADNQRVNEIQITVTEPSDDEDEAE
ncbi:MAG: HlyC/CorC family transporter [Clostridia bacterium]|nr:HlyC/CorC family transporter [Clostridia bacterium]